MIPLPVNFDNIPLMWVAVASAVYGVALYAEDTQQILHGAAVSLADCVALYQSAVDGKRPPILAGGLYFLVVNAAAKQ